MKGSKYDIGYFLTNKYFISWMRNRSEESDAFWKKWLRNHPDSQDAFHQAKGIMERIHFKDHPEIGDNKEVILDRILKNETSKYFQEGSEKQPRLHKIFPITLRLVAACLLAIFAASYLFSSFSVDSQNKELVQVAFVTKENPNGQKTAFYLPDKSRVILNAGSRISYPEEFGDKSREVFLEGEAYFDVTHDSLKTFLVHSGEIVTEVHGTAFNVYAYPGEPVNVALETGLVSVYPIEQSKPVIPQYLKPGEMLIVHEDFERSTKSMFDYDRQFGWKDGRLVFKEADMATLVKELERWYGVEITILGNPSDKWKINGVFSNESLKNVLEGVKYARNITYKINGHQVQIDTKP